MKILGIETSCDETAAAIVEDGRQILSNVVVSQIDIFSSYGGVIPEVAARNHLEAMMPVVHKAFLDAGFKTSDGKDDWSKIDAIAVTHTPGLLGSLLIGTLSARTLAILNDKPLYAVHHLKSHIYANWLLPATSTSYSYSKTMDKLVDQNLNQVKSEKPVPEFPLLALVISGGHTQILYMKSHNHFEIIGTTRDDAVGECFDKVAKILGLPYPGGPSVTNAAKSGNPNKYHLPHPKIDGLDFSFSGLKTAVLRAVQVAVDVPISFPSYELKNKLTDTQVADFAASFQKTAVDILLEKLDLAMTKRDVKSIVIAGGVSANSALREAAEKRYQNIFFPEPKFSGDNGAMVAAACYYEIESGVKPTDPYTLNIMPRSEIK